MYKLKLLLFTLTLLISSCLERSATGLKFSLTDDIYVENELITGTAPLNFASLHKYILKPKCISCHSGENAKPVNDPIDFSSYETMMTDRFVPLLIKGEPEISRLFKSVDSGEMPLDGVLHSSEIAFVRMWIKTCAPKDLLDVIPDSCFDDDDDDDDWDDDWPD